MAGHSKWANIRHRKGAQDAKRGKIFTKLIKEITISSRLGGGDVDSNPRLRKAVANAKSNNMAAEKIEKAIKKGTGELEGINYEEVTYEGYGPGGVAIMLDAITDNKNRTVADIRYILSKFGGNLGENGSVSWIFDKKGQIIINGYAEDEETVFEAALDAGAEDFEAVDDLFTITTDFSSLLDIRDNLDAKGLHVRSMEIEMVPRSYQSLKGKDAEAVLQLMETLDDHDDVSKVYSNFDLDDKVVLLD